MTIQNGPIAWPAMERYSDTPTFNTKAAVQQTGVPAPTLRAWERRYQLILPERAGNTYRLYSERDIHTIRWLKERIDNGMTISKAVALFQHLEREYQQSLLQHSATQADAGTALYTFVPEAVFKNTEQTMSEQADSTIQAQYTPYSQANSEQEAAQNHYPEVHNMRSVQTKLIDAFDNLDEQSASMLMSSMLAIYSIEQLCTELIVPTMWQVGKLWSEGHMTVPAEHFASNFFRGLLTNLFHVATNISTGPLVLICCAPGESHELAALMLALLLRRKGLHTVYLGQSIEISGLIQVIQRLAPILICVSLTMPSYLTALIDLSRTIDELPSPHPIFAFGGQAFCHYPNMISHIPGNYLDGDITSIIAQLQDMAVSPDTY